MERIVRTGFTLRARTKLTRTLLIATCALAFGCGGDPAESQASGGGGSGGSTPEDAALGGSAGSFPDFDADTDAAPSDAADDVVATTCPAGRLLTSSIRNPASPSGTVLPNVDLTKWENIWGLGANNVPEAWPGPSGITPAILAFDRDAYLAAELHVPSDIAATANGFYKNSAYYSGPHVDLAISKNCGDFSVPPPCSASNVAPDDAPTLRWKIATSGSFFCSLEPGADYYLNVRLHDPSDQLPVLCNAVACQVSLYQTH